MDVIINRSPLARGFLAGNRKAGENVRAHESWLAPKRPANAAPVEVKASPVESSTSRAATDVHAHAMYYQDDDFVIVERVKTIADRLKVSAAQVSLAWLLSRAGVTAPIIGASKMPQLEEAVASLKVVLTAADITYLDEAYKPHRVLGHS
jgi:aryl-alcohol dehydrogenase-like predicted oxidoreductase